MESWEGAQLNEAKEILAFELTKLVHGEEEATKAKEASHALFAGGANNANMPTVTVTAEDFPDGELDIISVFSKSRTLRFKRRRPQKYPAGRCFRCR